jgi:outer membrane protein assembly factor BamA
VRDFIGIQAGDLYRESALGVAQRSLYALGAYRIVEVAADTSTTRADSVVRVLLLLREDETRQVDAELGWGTIDCFRTRAQFTDRGLLRTTRRLDLSAQASKLAWADPIGSPITRNFCYREQLRRDSIASTRVNYNVSATLTQPGLGADRWVRSL